MILAKVVGTVWATRKDEKLVGTKLQIVKPVDLSYKLKDGFLVMDATLVTGEGNQLVTNRMAIKTYGPL